MVEVFTEVRAVLSSSVINAMEGPVEETLKRYIPTASVLKVRFESSIQYCILGTLTEINAASNELQKMLNCSKYTNISSDYFSFSVPFDKENNYFLNQNKISSHKSSSSETPIEKDPTTLKELCDLKRKMCIKKVSRFHLRERPRIKQRSNVLKTAHRHRYPKRKHILEKRILAYETEQDSDTLIRNLKEMKLSTENSSESESKVNLQSLKENFALKKSKNYEATSPYKYFCNLCSFKSKRSSHFAKHIAIHEKVHTLYKCGHCTFTSVRLSHLRRHEVIHSSTVHACAQCHYKTDNEKFLSRHVRLKHCNLRKDKKFSMILNCSYCSYHTTKQHYFERHQRMHCSKEKNVLHQCDKCCYKTHRKEHFVRHMNNVHSNKRPYLCHLCGKTFKRGDALQQHHQTHTEVKVEDNINFKCDICDKIFRSHSHLGEHKAVHSEERSFLCEICGASFKTRSVQRKHVATIHTKPGAFICNLCKKRFNTLYALKRHKKVHTDKEQESETEIGDSVKEFSDKKIKSFEVNALPQETGSSEIVPPSQESVLPVNNAISFSLQQTVVSKPEIIHHITPNFFQPPGNSTTLLYLTNGLTQF